MVSCILDSKILNDHVLQQYVGLKFDVVCITHTIHPDLVCHLFVPSLYIPVSNLKNFYL